MWTWDGYQPPTMHFTSTSETWDKLQKLLRTEHWRTVRQRAGNDQQSKTLPASVSLAVDPLMIAQKISHTSPSLNHLRLCCVSASEKPLAVLSRRKEYRLHQTVTALQRATQRVIAELELEEFQPAVAREATVSPLASSACLSNFQSGHNLFLCLEKRSEPDETQTQ